MFDFDEIEELESNYYNYTPINGACGVEGYQIDSVPVIVDGRTFVPVRFLATFLGADVMWDGATQTVTLVKLEDMDF